MFGLPKACVEQVLQIPKRLGASCASKSTCGLPSYGSESTTSVAAWVLGLPTVYSLVALKANMLKHKQVPRLEQTHTFPTSE